jgi:hypothetical protein
MLNQANTLEFPGMDTSDSIEDAKATVAKALHMMKLFAQEYDFAPISEPFQTVLGMAHKQFNVWTDDERNMYNWLEKVDEIRDTLSILDDYLVKTSIILNSAGDGIRESMQTIPAHATPLANTVMNFTNTLNARQKTQFLEVEAAIIRQTLDDSVQDWEGADKDTPNV